MATGGYRLCKPLISVLFFVVLVMLPCRAYDVYQGTFFTKMGTRRIYIGMTSNATLREESLQKPGPLQPAWAKAGCQNLDFQVLMGGIQSKGAALATEALMTAHRWAKKPDIVRGGPWCKPTLTRQDKQELQLVAKCSTVYQLFQVLEAVGKGKLDAHLRNVVYTEEAAPLPVVQRSCSQPMPCPRHFLPCPRPSARVLGRVVKKRASGKSKVSGSAGHTWRKGQGLKYASRAFIKSKWGNKGMEAKRKHQRTWKSKQC